MNILISGGSGMLGSALTKKLLAQGHSVRWLGRKPNSNAAVPIYGWNPQAGTIDEQALKGVDALVHLAGANVGEGRWSDARKKEIMDSRVLSTRLLLEAMGKSGQSVKTVVTASAVGIYGNTGDAWVDESSPVGSGFLAEVCKAWETETAKFQLPNTRLVTLRIGVVLSKDGGALPQMSAPVSFFAGAPLGSGKQYIPWIHISDLVRVMEHALEQTGMSGTYNASAPEPVTNQELTKHIAEVLQKPLFLPNVPEFALRLALGEMADIVIGGNRVSSKKLQSTGFSFQFNNALAAVNDLMGKSSSR